MKSFLRLDNSVAVVSKLVDLPINMLITLNESIFDRTFLLLCYILKARRTIFYSTS